MLYLRLIADVGAANPIAVTFLVPVFTIVRGWALLREGVTPVMVLGCTVIFLGTGLAKRVLKASAFARE